MLVAVRASTCQTGARGRQLRDKHEDCVKLHIMGLHDDASLKSSPLHQKNIVGYRRTASATAALAAMADPPGAAQVTQTTTGSLFLCSAETTKNRRSPTTVTTRPRITVSNNSLSPTNPCSRKTKTSSRIPTP